jgi:signal transduction histidine kinase
MGEESPPAGHGLFARAEMLVVFGVVAPLAVLGWLSWRAVDALESRVDDGRTALARVIAERVDEEIRHDIELAYVAAGRARPPDLEAARLALKKSAEALGGAHLELLDEHGNVLAHAGAGPFETDPHVVASAPLALSPWHVVIRETKEAAPGFLTRLLVLVPILGAVAGLFAWGSARAVKRPLETLTEAAERIATGELDRPVPELPHDEVGRLGRSLETMREALQKSVEVLEARVVERTKQLEELSKELVARDERRGELVKKLISAQEEERKRVARELHDETSQTLSALLMRIDAERGDPAELRALASRSLDGIHRLIRDLRPSMLDDLGLVPALKTEVGRQLGSRGIAVRFEVDGLDERLPRELETLLYRIAQEAATNVVRHSRAENVLVQLYRRDACLSLEVEDDGEGFDPASVARPLDSGRGLGLLGMRERVELLGGTFKVDSSPGNGTRIAVEVPLPC